MKKNKQLIRKSIISVILLFIIANIFIVIHTYKFTHYDTSIPPSLDKNQKIGIKDIILGINTPRPSSEKQPSKEFETIVLSFDNKTIKGWMIKSDTVQAKGIVLLAHGYNGSK